MKKTLTNLLSFSLFALLSSFSLFANSATFTTDTFGCPDGQYIVNPNQQIYIVGSASVCTLTTFPSSNAPKCYTAGSCRTSSSSTTYYSPTRLGVFVAGTALANATLKCPANSTLSGSTCTPNAGFSAVNTDTSANGGKGSWSVVPAGQECQNTTQVYNSTNGICGSVTENTQCPADKPFLRFKHPNTYYCHATDAAGDFSDVGLLTTLTGSAAVVMSGAFSSIAACVATVVCGLGLALVATGSILTGFEYFSGDAPIPASSSPGVMQVVFNPNSPAPQNDVLKVLPSGTIIPPANSIPTDNVDVVSYVKDGVTHNIDTKNVTSSYTGSFGGQSQSGVLMSTPTGSATVKTASVSQIGTSGGQPVNQIKTSSGTFSGSSLSPQIGTNTQYQTGTSEEVTQSPPVIDSGTGTGIGSGSCGSFACESTALQSLEKLKQINEAQKVSSEQFGSVQSNFNALGSSVDSQMADLITQFNGSGYHDALQSAFGSILPVSPFEKIYASSNQSCVFNFTLFNHEYHLSMCEALPFLHPALAFILQFGLAIFVLNLVFERPRG